MKKTEAAEILARALDTRARKYGFTVIDKDFYWAILSEARGGHETFAPKGSPLYEAAHAAPAYRTVRSAAKRLFRHRI